MIACPVCGSSGDDPCRIEGGITEATHVARTAQLEPRQGMRFAHARMRQALPGLRIDEQPAEVCRVTRVTSTAVYYRAGDGERTLYVSKRDRFAEKVGEVLPAS